MAARASTSAPTPVELSLYHVGDQRIVEMGVLEGWFPQSLLPEPTQAGIPADASLHGGTLGIGFYFALSEGGEILDLGYLSPLLPMQTMDEPLVEVEGDDSPTEDEDDGVEKSSQEDEEVEGDDSPTEDEEEAEEEEDGVEKSSEEEVVVDDSPTEDEEEAGEEEGAGEEEEGMDESEEEKTQEDHKSYLSMQARINIDSSHAILVLFDEGSWKLTKGYSIKWLRRGEEQQMLELINKGKNQQVTSNWLKGCTSNLDFEGPLFHSNDLEDTIKKEMSLMINHFTLTKKIGKGATSEVYQCFLKKLPMLQYAVKIIKAKSTYDLDAYEQREPREIKIMSCFDDSSALKFYQAWHGTKGYLDVEAFDEEESSDEYSTDEDDDSEFDVCILMEIASRTLKDSLAVGEHSVGIEDGWKFFEKIAKAVSSMHQKGVIHRDVKPPNIFIGPNEEIKLGDFGDSCWMNNYMGGRMGTPNRGTSQYMAPELSHGKVSSKVDIYSLGVVFLEIFHPFETESERLDTLMKLKENKYLTTWVGDILLLKMLTALDPIQRASISDVLDYLSNRFPGQ